MRVNNKNSYYKFYFMWLIVFYKMYGLFYSIIIKKIINFFIKEGFF